MTDLLYTYEKNFKKNNDKINSNFSKIEDADESQKEKINKSNLLEENDRLIEQQKKILKQIDIELSTLTNKKEYNELNAKFLEYKKNLEASQKKLYELYLKDDSKNNSFLENNLITENSNILMNKERTNLQRYKKLHQVRKALTTTEEMGSDIMENMDDQSKNMKNVTNKLKKMGGDLDESNSILNKMRNRVKRNKILVIILAIIFILVLLGIFIFKFTKRNRSEV